MALSEAIAAKRGRLQVLGERRCDSMTSRKAIVPRAGARVSVSRLSLALSSFAPGRVLCLRSQSCPPLVSHLAASRAHFARSLGCSSPSVLVSLPFALRLPAPFHLSRRSGHPHMVHIIRLRVLCLHSATDIVQKGDSNAPPVRFSSTDILCAVALPQD